MTFIIDYFKTPGYESLGSYMLPDNTAIVIDPINLRLVLKRNNGTQAIFSPTRDFFWSSIFIYALRPDFRKMLICNEDGLNIYALDIVEGDFRLITWLIRHTDQSLDFERFDFKDMGDTLLALYEHGVVAIDSETLEKRWSVDNLTYFDHYLKVVNGVIWYTDYNDDDVRWGYKLATGELVKP